MAAPVLRVIYANQPIFEGKCIIVQFQKPAHEQLIRAIGILTQNAVDVIGWLNILISKAPLMILNYIHMNQMCTLYLFDPKYVSSKLLKTHLAGALGLATDEQITEYIASL